MSIMQAEIYDAFIEAGASEPKARAAAEVIAQKPQSDELATKDYIEKKVAQLEGELKAGIARLEGKIDTKIAELKGYQFWNMIISIGATLTAISIATGVIIAVIS